MLLGTGGSLASYEYISFRLEVDDQGEQSLTIIDGGSHTGGVARGRLRWSGGLDVGTAHALNDLIASSVIMLVGGIQGMLIE